MPKAVLGWMGGSVACSISMHWFDLQHYINRDMGVHTGNSILGRWKQDGQKFKVILNYIESFS